MTEQEISAFVQKEKTCKVCRVKFSDRIAA